MSAEVRSILFIQSSSDELKIETVKKLLPFKPTKFWQKGDQMYDLNGIIPGGFYRMSKWAYEDFSFNKGILIHLKEAVIPILNLFLPYKEQLLQIKTMGFETSLCIVISGKISEKPIMHLNYMCIKGLYDLGLEIDFDTYLS